MPFPANPVVDDTLSRMGRAWRELRRGASTAVIRDRMFGTGADAIEPAQLDVLDLLVMREHWRMSDLAIALRVDPSTVTRTLQRMEAAGLARRTPDDFDGRVVIVHPTAAGRQRHAAVAARRTAILTDLLDTFTEAEREQLVSLLERFIERARQVRGRDANAGRARVTPGCATPGAVCSGSVDRRG